MAESPLSSLHPSLRGGHDLINSFPPVNSPASSQLPGAQAVARDRQPGTDASQQRARGHQEPISKARAATTGLDPDRRRLVVRGRVKMPAGGAIHHGHAE